MISDGIQGYGMLFCIPLWPWTPSVPTRKKLNPLSRIPAMKKQRSQLGTDLAYVWLLIQLEIPICKLAFKRRFSHFCLEDPLVNFPILVSGISHIHLMILDDDDQVDLGPESTCDKTLRFTLAAPGRSPKPHWNAGRFGGMDWNAQNVFRAWKTIQSMMYDIYIYYIWYDIGVSENGVYSQSQPIFSEKDSLNQWLKRGTWFSEKAIFFRNGFIWAIKNTTVDGFL